MMKQGLLCLLFVALTTSCMERMPEESYRESVSALMNGRKYAEAIHSLESHIQQPGGAEAANLLLLAQAHLGASGFELVSFADRALEMQKAQSKPVSRLFPGCTLEKIIDPPGLEDPGFKCLLKRLLLQLPSAKDPHFARARDLLRLAYPEPEQTPAHVNFLISTVEIGSALSRAGALLEFFIDLPPEVGSSSARYYPIAVRGAAQELKSFLVEARFGLARAGRSHARVARYLFGLKQTEVFQQIEETLVFAEETGVPALMRFADRADELLVSPESIEFLKAITAFARDFSGNAPNS